MKFKKTIFSISAVILGVGGISAVNSRPAKAQSLDIAKGYYTKTFTPYVKNKNSFIYAQNNLPIKKYNYYNSVVYENKKVTYSSFQTPVIIDGIQFYNLGDGGYIKLVNGYSNKKGITLTKNSYVYDKNGKLLKTFRGEKAYFTKGTVVKSTVKSKTYNAPISYYNIGKGNYVSSTQVSTLNDKGTLFVSQNSYIYNKKGKRVNKEVIKAGSLVNYSGKAKDGRNNVAYYYLTNNGKKDRHITNYKIGKSYFFSIGRNKYIKANNINLINGQNLITTQPIIIEIAQDTYAYNASLDKIDKLYHQGQKVKVDQAVQEGTGDYTTIYYRVAGTAKDPIYIQSGMGPDYGWGAYAWWEDGAATIAKQTLQTTDYWDLHYTQISFKKGVTETYYNMRGDVVKADPNGELAASQAVYIYNPKTKKVELYYGLRNTLIDKSGAEDDRQSQALDNLFVKASDVDIHGLKLKPTNTAQEAEEDAKIAATKSQKSDLENLIAQAKDVKVSDKYRLDTLVDRSLYDFAIKNSQDLLDQKQEPSQAEIKEMIWQLTYAKHNLKGKKVKVKNINNLTAIEANQVHKVMSQAYNEGSTYPHVSLYAKYAHQDGYYPTTKWTSNEKNAFFLIRKDEKRVKLDIADFATEK